MIRKEKKVLHLKFNITAMVCTHSCYSVQWSAHTHVTLHNGLYTLMLFCICLYTLMLFCTCLYTLMLFCTCLYTLMLFCICLYTLMLFCTCLYTVMLFCTCLYIPALRDLCVGLPLNGRRPTVCIKVSKSALFVTHTLSERSEIQPLHFTYHMLRSSECTHTRTLGAVSTHIHTHTHTHTLGAMSTHTHTHTHHGKPIVWKN